MLQALSHLHFIRSLSLLPSGQLHPAVPVAASVIYSMYDVDAIKLRIQVGGSHMCGQVWEYINNPGLIILLSINMQPVYQAAFSDPFLIPHPGCQTGCRCWRGADDDGDGL